jgi:hypothetical protein
MESAAGSCRSAMREARLVDLSLTEEMVVPVVSRRWIPLHAKTEARGGRLATEQVRPPTVERPHQVSYRPAPGMKHLQNALGLDRDG